MNMENTRLAAFRQAASILPMRLQHAALALPNEIQQQCEELHLRAGAGLSYSMIGKETPLPDVSITVQDLQDVLGRATRYSVHSFEDSLQYGFLTIEGGHRLGLCGTVVLHQGKIHGIRLLSSVNLRIASQCIGTANDIIDTIWNGGQTRSTLFIAAPAFGKTTVLRDCIRQLSNRQIRVCVADERYELSGLVDGESHFDLGPTTDILCGAKKADAVLQLIKTMSPQVLAVDEITAPEDITAISYAAHCGVAVLATAHAQDFADLQRKPLYTPLLQNHVFQLAVEIQIQQGIRSYRTCQIGGKEC